MDQAKNFAKGTLAAGIDDDDVSITLLSGHGARFPTPPFNATLWNSTDYPDPSDDPDVEIVRVTNISTDTLTVTRYQEGLTGPFDHNSEGKTFQLVAGLTAKVINDEIAPVSALADDGTVFTVLLGETVSVELNRSTGKTIFGDVGGVGEGTKLEINDPAATVTITKQLILPNLPTSNPAVAGALWNDSGTVKISAG